MPIYRWLNRKSKKELEVLRTFDKIEEIPTTEEGADEGDDPAEWERVIGKINVTKAAAWGPGKGYW